MRSDLPSGTVTFCFTDVEGSTRLLHELGAKGYADALAEHRRLIREACTAEGGIEVDTQGDAFFFAFGTAPGALAAASAFTEALASGPIQVRVGLHTGTPLLTEEGYVGDDVHRAARIAACGHGGQVLVSSSTAALLSPGDTASQGFLLSDLGEHRLKDLSAPERVYQLGDGDFPPLKSLYRTNLPVPATPFLGREAELQEVVGLLSESRLLTLTGPGGTGKTRLALQAAGLVSEAYPDGIFWIPLAPLRDPELVLPTLARTLDVTEDSDEPLAETLISHLSGKSLLVLLDNVEHLLPKAAEQIALLRSSNGSRLLVTSRERLRVSGEQTYPVPPLAESDGEALFATRARAVDPAFAPTEAVRELCLRLDELPLALELAAARTALFSPEQLLDKLSQRLDLLKGERDADPRQQTLGATIAWSYDLLSPDEQHLFRRLSVFSGGCTYEAAEEVAGADPDTLQSLLDKSLLRKRDSKAGPRYWMLETIREYAAEKLGASGEAEELGRRYAEHFLTLAEEAYPNLTQSAERLDRMEIEHDNFRAALDWLEEAGATQLVLQLVGALGRFWYLRTHVFEGRRRLETALGADPSRTSPRARALTSAHGLAALAGENAAARGHSEEAELIYRELDDAWGIAYARYLIGTTVATDGQWEQAREIFEESRRAFCEFGDDHFTLIATRALAWMCEELGDVERYRALTQENLELARATGNERMQARALSSLSHYVLEEGRVDDALAMQREALRIDARFGELYGIAHDLASIAMSLAVAGHGQRTVELVSSIDALYAEAGAAMPSYLSGDNEKALTLARAELDEAAFAHAWERGRQLTLDGAVALALETPQ